MVKHMIGAIICLLSITSCSNNEQNVTQDINENFSDTTDPYNSINTINQKDSSDIIYTEATYWLEKLSKEFDNDNNHTQSNIAVDDISGKIYDFEQAAENVLLLNNNWGDSTSKQLKKLKLKLVGIQKKYFPIYRRIYANDIKEKLWENDISVHFEGKTIRFVGSIFVNNKNKKDVQETVELKLKNLRFKYVIYQWHEGSSGTRYTLDSKNDTDL